MKISENVDQKGLHHQATDCVMFSNPDSTNGSASPSYFFVAQPPLREDNSDLCPYPCLAEVDAYWLHF